MKKCKACGKELIGKEKLFCHNCFSKGTSKVKKVVLTVGGIFLTVGSIVLTKGKFTGGKDS